MDFEPNPNDVIDIEGNSYTIQAHPNAPLLAFGQEARKALVYQVKKSSGANGFYALKVFKKQFQEPRIEQITKKLSEYKTINGMKVCGRICLNKSQHSQIIQQYPELEYAVLMPWISGSTWHDVILNRSVISVDQGYMFAWLTSQTLSNLEQMSVAHCDISNGNIVLDLISGTEVQLIDVEDIYHKDLPMPSKIPAGTDGYAHKTFKHGVWNELGDRFAGAIILAEMISWHNPEFRDLAQETSYFAQEEIQDPHSQRYETALKTLSEASKVFADLFRAAWMANTLDQCPKMADWEEAINDALHPSAVEQWEPIPMPPPPPPITRTKIQPNIQGKHTYFSTAPTLFCTPHHREDVIQLSWIGAKNAEKFELQISHDSNFQQVSLKEFEARTTLEKKPETETFYRVRAVFAHGISEWSNQIRLP